MKRPAIPCAYRGEISPENVHHDERRKSLLKCRHDCGPSLRPEPQEECHDHVTHRGRCREVGMALLRCRAAHASPSAGTRFARLARPDAGDRELKCRMATALGAGQYGYPGLTKNEAHGARAGDKPREAQHEKRFFGNTETLAHGDQHGQCRSSDRQHCPAVRTLPKQREHPIRLTRMQPLRQGRLAGPITPSKANIASRRGEVMPRSRLSTSDIGLEQGEAPEAATEQEHPEMPRHNRTPDERRKDHAAMRRDLAETAATTRWLSRHSDDDRPVKASEQTAQRRRMQMEQKQQRQHRDDRLSAAETRRRNRQERIARLRPRSRHHDEH